MAVGVASPKGAGTCNKYNGDKGCKSEYEWLTFQNPENK